MSVYFFSTQTVKGPFHELHSSLGNSSSFVLNILVNKINVNQDEEEEDVGSYRMTIRTGEVTFI
jgi:hypothetical protein